MFADISPAYLIASLFFLASGCYLYLSVVTFKNNTKSKSRNDYLSAGLCLILYSFFYGLMTIAANEILIRAFWAVGFTSGCLFFSRWLLFSSNMAMIKYKKTRSMISASSVLTVFFCVFCVLSNDAVFVSTRYGVQFSYHKSLVFIAAIFYIAIMIVAFLILFFRWWRESVMKRDRAQALLFLILSAFIAPIGIAADFIIPGMTEQTAIPLASLCFLPVSLPLFVSMRKYKTLSITVPNASGYVFNTVTIPTLVLDHKNNINLENNAAFDFLGCSVIGKNISEIILSDEKTPEQSFFRTGFASEKVTVETPFGTSICDMLLAVENDKYNDALCKVVLLRDITENERKDNMLRVALKQANAASKAKSSFLANMSHEIRTPMNAIIGMTMIAESSDEMDRIKDAIGKIRSSSHHLLGVINDVLDVSKIESGKYELSPTDFEFESMLQQVVTLNDFRISEKQQDLKVHIDPAIPKTIHSDRQRLAQVITNLVSNAVKFTPEKGSITINTELLESNNEICTILVRVTDTGIGISPEQQAKLFQSFQQAETSTSRKFGGTGLGLVICKSIVEMMGGKIWIESELGKGATFAFTISVKHVPEKEPSVSNWSNLRILVVDDDPITLEYLGEMAGRYGACCDTVPSAKDAFASIERNGAYDLYFVDYIMPVTDGIEFTRRLKMEETYKAPVVMISATEWSTFEDEAKCAGVDDFIAKPIFPSDVEAVINSFLGIDKTGIDDSTIKYTDQFDGRHVLIAEDIEINREVVAALLEPLHLDIAFAANGKEAVRMVSEAPGYYDMIFMDIQMPEMDGYEATQAIRSLDAARANDIPIIAMTANVFKEDIEKCIASGMNAHVGKPLDFDEVVRQLREHM